MLDRPSLKTLVTRLAVCALLAAAFVLPLAGCGKAKPSQQGAKQETIEVAPGVTFGKDKPLPAETPPPPMLRDPKSSVYSYLLWISYAYRILDSDVATMAFSPQEEVRVNSYVELNRQEGRALDQKLLEFKLKDVRTKGDTATVSAEEQWAYRYIDIKTVKYNSDVLKATYDTTYTVVKDKQKGWLVDDVEATPRGEVK